LAGKVANPQSDAILIELPTHARQESQMRDTAFAKPAVQTRDVEMLAGGVDGDCHRVCAFASVHLPVQAFHIITMQ